MGCVSSSGARADLDGRPVGLKHFDKGRVLGEGGFGKVKAATKRGEAPLRWYAMKILNKENVVDKRRFQEVFRERDMLSALRHDRICNLYYAFQDPKHLYLVMDLALGGDLRYQLNHNAQGLPFTEARVRIYTAQVVEALDYVHSQGIIHRDVKPENLLLDGNGWVMLTDFGIARDVDEAGLCQSGSGTGGYMPPEIYTRSHAHSKTADWFALGVTMHEFLTKRRPFRGDDIRQAGRMLSSSGKIKPSHEKEGENEPLVAQFLQDCQAEEIGLSAGCVDLLSRLFCVKRGERLGANGLKDFTAHPWFAQSEAFDWAKISDGTHEVPFLPNTKRMNAEPDADIHAVFMGDEEERRLRNLKPDEQKLFEGYEYDYTEPKPELPLVRDFGSMARTDSRKSVATITNATTHTADSFSSRGGMVSTQPRTPRVRTAQRYTTRSMDEVALTAARAGEWTTNSTTSETTRGAEADDEFSNHNDNQQQQQQPDSVAEDAVVPAGRVLQADPSVSTVSDGGDAAVPVAAKRGELLQVDSSATLQEVSDVYTAPEDPVEAGDENAASKKGKDSSSQQAAFASRKKKGADDHDPTSTTRAPSSVAAS